MTRHRFIVTALLVAAAHLAVALTSLAAGFGIGIRRFDAGSAGLLEKSLNGLADVLFLPGSLLYRWAPLISGPAEWALILGNSLSWGLVGASLIAVVAARRKRP